MPSPLFSIYSQGENRVTATILAVFERLSFGLVERVLQALCQEPNTALLTFSNQPPGVGSVPDGRIRASFAYWIETKRVPRAVDVRQLRDHLRALDGAAGVERQRLLVLTPDAEMPPGLRGLGDDRVAWASFDDLLTALEGVAEPGGDWLASERPVPSEYERGLLRELARFIVAEGLVGGAAERVAVVAARTALQDYLRYAAYICQPNRAFQPCSRLAFYARGRIDRRVPAIRGRVESVVLSEEGWQRAPDVPEATRAEVLALVGRLRAAGDPRLGGEAKVVFLSQPDAPETLRLEQDIVNDLESEPGRPVAFTQNQRYVPLAAIKRSPKTTSELLAGATTPGTASRPSRAAAHRAPA